MSTLADDARPVARYDDVFEHLPVAALVVSRLGEILSINGRARERLRLTAAAMPEALRDLFAGTPEGLARDLIAASSGGWITLKQRTPAGTGPRQISFNVAPLRQDGRRVAQLVLSETSGTPTAHAFAALNSSLSSAEVSRQRAHTRRLSENNKRLETFSYTAAHDLRAPLRNISSLLDYVEEDYGADMPGEAQGMLSKARAAAMRLQDLISDLLRHARSDAQSLTLKDIALAPMIVRIEAQLSDSLASASGRITLDPIDARIRADEMLLAQLLENLVGNAIKYSDRSRALEVVVRVSDLGGGQRRLAVEDNGIGFDPAFETQIFEPFQRLHTATEIEGSGVGLATCRLICERHGWVIRASGRPARGATFSITGDF